VISFVKTAPETFVRLLSNLGISTLCGKATCAPANLTELLSHDLYRLPSSKPLLQNQFSKSLIAKCPSAHKFLYVQLGYLSGRLTDLLGAQRVLKATKG